MFSKRVASLVAVLAVFLPFILFLTQALILGPWIIDDAAISFAYARSAAAGYGLVSQPGATPVEGFSDPLWVAVMIPFFMIGQFSIVYTPKIIGALFVLLTFLVLRQCLIRFWNFGNLAIGFTLTLLACNPSFVIWTMSGLENSLFAFLTTLLLWRLLITANASTWHWSEPLVCGCIAACAALTRPDGAIYFGAAPAVMIARWAANLRNTESKSLRTGQYLAIYAATAGICFGGYLVFRYQFFHDILPNTYYAKDVGLFQSPGLLGPLKKMVKIIGVFRSIFTTWPFAIIGSVAFCVLNVLLLRQERRPSHLVWLLFVAISIAAFVILPIDWMPFFRFATPFIVFSVSLFVALIRHFVLAAPPLSVMQRWLATGTVLCAIIFHYMPQTAEFSEDPTVPYDVVTRFMAERYNRYAEQLNIRNGSLLLPDCGGTLFCSKLRIWDLAGLCDRTIGRNIGRNPEKVREYVFTVVKPTFIHTHRPWTLLADFDLDPRFRRDYVPIFEYEDPLHKPMGNRRIYCGDYVRRDAIADKAKIFRAIKEGYPVRPLN